MIRAFEGLRPVPLLVALGLLWSGEVIAVDRSSPYEQWEDETMIGELTRSEIEQRLPDWVGATVDASPDVEAAIALAGISPGATVTVFFGSWCEDSRREMTRLWKALDLVAGDVSFEIEYVGIDREMLQPEKRLSGRQILFVPTFVVEREGVEVGRIIEQPQAGIETDLLFLLDGRASGWLSAREDLPAPVQGRPR
jgi:thiol-disulfide isomerase/thioredoxin